MRTLSSLALLTLMACPGPVVDDPDRLKSLLNLSIGYVLDGDRTF